ncbi:MAG: ferritin-like domain-containing protein [Enhygromyxa sp.]
MDRDQRLRNFRLRLLAAFGVGVVPGLLYSGSAAADEEITECYELADGESCLPLNMTAEILDRLEFEGNETDEGCVIRSVVAQVFEGVEQGQCCYTINVDLSQCEPDPYLECNSCYGRPYVIEAEPVTAPSVPNDGWGTQAAADMSPTLAGLTPEQRAALAEFWSDNARAEHSSVAGFHRLCLELIAHGAPLELLERSQKAAADELAHARICYALASHYAGRALGPGLMPIGEAAPIAATLVELAIATAREGCLAETSAAWLASETAAAASDPAVRVALEQIAREEEEHAELAWMTLRWAIEAGGAEVREAVAEVFASARPSAAGGAPIDLPSHGMLTSAEARAIGERAFREVLVPLMRAAA